jgi:hypothetical protein
MQFFVKNIKTSLKISLLLPFVLYASAASAALPKLVIKKITNDTDHEILFIDTYAKNKSVTIAAHQTAAVDLHVSTDSTKGDMRECMAEKAQYIARKAGDQNNEHDVYIHMNLTPGGVDDGSGFITGSLGSTVVTFLLASAQGSCAKASQNLKENFGSYIEASLELKMPTWAKEKNVFALSAQYKLEGKR